MRTLELASDNVNTFNDTKTERVGDLVADQELIAEVEAVFSRNVDMLDQAPIDPEKEGKMGSIYKPVISTDWQKGARN